MVAASSMPRLPRRNGCLKHLNTPPPLPKARNAVSDQKCTEVCNEYVSSYATLVPIARKDRTAYGVFKIVTESSNWRIIDRREVQYPCESTFGGYNRSTVLFMPTKAAVCRHP
jgi:hypothetical protein